MEKIFNFITLPRDKANHALYGLIVYSLISLWSPILALIIVFFLALGKELWDEYIYNGFDYKDLLYTIFIPVILYLLERIL